MVASRAIKRISPIKWAGGKHGHLPYLIPIWAAHYRRRLVEPFCGGLSVAFGLNPKSALLNDANWHLINFWKHLQKGMCFNEKDAFFANTEESFLRLRDRFNEWKREWHLTNEAQSLARYFYYLNRHAFNGLYRVNSQGEFNVAWGKYKNPQFKGDLREYAPILKDWVFEHGDFTKLWLQPEDFVFCDPPYDLTFAGYSSDGFDWADQERLIDWLKSHPGPIVITNSATERLTNLYRSAGYKVNFLNARRSISCDGNRAPARELIATKNLEVTA